MILLAVALGMLCVLLGAMGMITLHEWLWRRRFVRMLRSEELLSVVTGPDWYLDNVEAGLYGDHMEVRAVWKQGADRFRYPNEVRIEDAP